MKSQQEWAAEAIKLLNDVPGWNHKFTTKSMVHLMNGKGDPLDALKDMIRRSAKITPNRAGWLFGAIRQHGNEGRRS